MYNRKLTIVLAMLFTLPALSQTTVGKNLAKINLSAFALKGFNVQYERQVGKKVTVALGYSKIPTSTLALKGYYENQIDHPNVDISQFKLGTSIFTPEVRYYFSKKGAFNGFYLAAYSRLSNYDLKGPVNYTTSLNVKRSTLFNGSLKAYTFGLLAGASFKLSHKLYLDWWIIGSSIGGANGNFKADTPLTEPERVSLERELESLDIPYTKTKSQVTNSGAIVTTTGSMVGFRGLGINLGIRF